GVNSTRRPATGTRKSGIARISEPERRVIEDGALRARRIFFFVECGENSVANDLREERLPPQTIIQGQPRRDLPRIRAVSSQIPLAHVGRVGSGLHDLAHFPGKEVRHSLSGFLPVESIVDGYNNSDIAKMYGMKEAAARQIVSRGRAEVRRLLGDSNSSLTGQKGGRGNEHEGQKDQGL